MNNCVFIGNFTRDPELRTTKSGQSVLNFTLGINKQTKKANGEKVQETNFLDFEMWASGAEVVAKYFKKGDPIVITSAEARQDRWTDDEGKNRSKIVFRVVNFEFPPINRKGKTDKDAESEGENEGAEVESSEAAVPF